MLRNKNRIDLHLFDGAAAPAGGDGPQAVNGSSASSQGSEDLSKVVYGKEQGQATDQGQIVGETQVASPTTGGESVPETPAVSFDELIKGQYKEDFDNRVQSIMERRFRKMDALQQERDSMNKVIEPLMDIYGVSSLDDLRRTVLTDNNRIAQLADEAGMTEEQYLAYRETQRENQEYREAEQARLQQEETDRIYSDWMDQAEALKEDYPMFDLEAESEDPQFISMLQAGVDVRTAYEARHLTEILRGTVSNVADAVRNHTVDAIRSRGIRPQEGGLSEQAGVVRKTDASKLTRADREEIARRVQRGENISF